MLLAPFLIRWQYEPLAQLDADFITRNVAPNVAPKLSPVFSAIETSAFFIFNLLNALAAFVALNFTESFIAYSIYRNLERSTSSSNLAERLADLLK